MKRARAKRTSTVGPDERSGSLAIDVVNSLEPADHWAQFRRAVLAAEADGSLERIVGSTHAEALLVRVGHLEEVGWGLYANGFLAALAVVHVRGRLAAEDVTPSNARAGRA